MLGALALGPLACKPAPQLAPDVRGTVPTTRRVIDVRFDTVWVYGGANGALLAPAFLAADSSTVYIGDPGRHAIVALDGRTGRQRWRTTGEHDTSAVSEPRTLTARRGGGVLAFDADRRTIVALDTAGRVDTRLAVPQIDLAQSLCELPNGSLLIAPMSSSTGLVEISATGEARGVHSFPWPDVTAGSGLVAATLLAPTARGCVSTLIFGLGFALFEERSFATPHEYVEPSPLPRVVRTRTERAGEVVVSTALAEHVIAAQDVATTSRDVIIAFGGRTDDRAHLLDRYDVGGAYRASYRVSRRVEAIASNASTLFVLAHRAGAPIVVALRWPPSDAREP